MKNIQKFTLYFCAKWLLLYLWVAAGAESKWTWSVLSQAQNFLYTLVVVLAFPVLEAFLLAPLAYVVLKQNGWKFAVLAVLMFVCEFAIGWFLTNEKLADWMLWKIFLSLFLFILFYKNHLNFRKIMT